MNTELWDELAHRKAIITGDHTDNEGIHGSADIRLTVLNTHPFLLQETGVAIAKPFRVKNVQTVVYLKERALPLAHIIAGACSTSLNTVVRTVPALDSGKIVEIPGTCRNLVSGRNILLLQAVPSDMRCPRALDKAVRACGGMVKGFASLATPLPPRVREVFHISTLFPLNHWRPEECPLCRQGIPIRRMAEAAPGRRQR